MRADLFKGAKVQYDYDRNERIYSVKVTLSGKPRILTLRVGEDFTELSLADKRGNLLEVLREENGNVNFEKLKG